VDAPLSQLGPQDVLVAAEVDVLRAFQADAAAREHRLYTKAKTTLQLNTDSQKKADAAEVDVLRALQADAAAREHRLYTKAKTTQDKTLFLGDFLVAAEVIYYRYAP
jgi:hypothetical protein